MEVTQYPISLHVTCFLVIITSLEKHFQVSTLCVPGENAHEGSQSESTDESDKYNEYEQKLLDEVVDTSKSC
jgi:hypothetical protein